MVFFSTTCTTKIGNTGNVSAFSSLPLCLYGNIFSFASSTGIGEYEEDKEEFPIEKIKTLHDKNIFYTNCMSFGLIDRMWYLAIKQQMVLYEQTIVHFEFTTFDSVDRQKFIQQVNKKTKELTLSMGFVPHFSQPFRLNPFLIQQEQQQWEDITTMENLLWDKVFRVCGHSLERLDLTNMLLTSAHMPLLLKQCALHCTKLKELILPIKPKESFHFTLQEKNNVFNLMDVLCTQALPKWTQTLNKLTIPYRLTTSPQQDHLLVNAIATNCPQLTHYDGFKFTYEEDEAMLCDEHWEISLQTWTQLNKNCSTKLKEFHWVIVPLEDVYLEIFGQFVKPNLTKLTLAMNNVQAEKRPFHPMQLTTKGLCDVLTSCPQLTHFCIHYSSQFLLPSVLFNDFLLEKLSLHCPLLEKFEIREIHHDAGEDFVHMDNLSDLGLLNLLKEMKQLKHLKLHNAPPITTKTLGFFLTNQSGHKLKTFELEIGETPPLLKKNTTYTIHSTPLAYIVELMELIVNTMEKGTFMYQHVVLQLICPEKQLPVFEMGESGLGIEETKKINCLTKQLIAKHPQLIVKFDQLSHETEHEGPQGHRVFQLYTNTSKCCSYVTLK